MFADDSKGIDWLGALTNTVAMRQVCFQFNKSSGRLHMWRESLRASRWIYPSLFKVGSSPFVEPVPCCYPGQLGSLRAGQSVLVISPRIHFQAFCCFISTCFLLETWLDSGSRAFTPLSVMNNQSACHSPQSCHECFLLPLADVLWQKTCKLIRIKISSDKV